MDLGAQSMKRTTGLNGHLPPDDLTACLSGTPVRWWPQLAHPTKKKVNLSF